MANFSNNAEGMSNGVALTAGSGGNTGGASGDYFPTITITGTPTIEGSTAQAAYGTKSIHISNGSGQKAYVRWTSLNSDRCAGYFHFRWGGSLPASLGDMLTMRNSSAGVMGVGLTSDNKFHVKSGAGASLNGGWVVPSFSGTQWYRCEYEIIVGTTTSNGTINVRLYLAGSSTPISGCTYSGSAENTGTTNLDQMWLGANTTGAVWDFYLDAISLVTGSTTQAALPGVNNPPVVNAGSDITCTAGVAGLHLSGTATDSDGTISSVAWSRVSGPDSPTVTTSASGTGTASATAAADVDVIVGTYVFRLTGTDSNSASTTDDVTVYVSPAVGDTAPASSTSGAWASFGGAASASAAVADSDDATGVETDDDPTSEVQSFVLPPLGLGPISIVLRGYRTAATGISRLVQLYKADGATKIYETTQTPGQSVADLPVTPDGTALAAIPTAADRTALVLKVTSSKV